MSDPGDADAEAGAEGGASLPEGVEIDPAEMDDLERLADLWAALAAGQREHGSRLLAAENREPIRESLARQILSGWVLVARHEEEVVGFASVEAGESGLQRTADRGTIQNLYVVPALRGAGIGTALAAAAERRLAEAGAEEVAIEVMADNEAARRLYRRLGYEPHRIELAKPLESDTPTT